MYSRLREPEPSKLEPRYLILIIFTVAAAKNREPKPNTQAQKFPSLKLQLIS